MTGIKVCGLTRPEDVALAAALGAAYVGFVFARESPRRVDAGLARELGSAAAGTRRVGVFVDEAPDEVDRAITAGGLDFIQIHRPARADDVAHERPAILVCQVNDRGVDAPPDELAKRAHAVLHDAAKGAGSGRSFDWRRFGRGAGSTPRWLGGGLDADNVVEAIRIWKPDVVDVASGVESRPGIKSEERMRAFFEAVRRADA